MKITKQQLRRIIREEVKSTQKYDDDPALTGDQDELPDALQKGIIDKENEEANESIVRITKRRLRRLVAEQAASVEASAIGSSHGGSSGIDDHHWPRVDWSNIGELVDKWTDMEEKAWDTADPSMNPDDIKNVEAKKAWDDQVENAALDMEAELTKRIRKVALSTMKEYTDLLIGGEYL